jgi:hypothetical protein
MRMNLMAALSVLVPTFVFAQQTSTTSGPCSPIAPNNSGTITIQCGGISTKLGNQLVVILNRIAKNQLDPDAVMAKLDEIQRGVNEIREAGAPRRLSNPQRDVLVSRLTPLSKPRLSVLVLNGSAEIEDLSKDFQDVFKRLGWPLGNQLYGMVPSSFRGISVGVKSQQDHPAAAEVLVRTLTEMGFLVEASADSKLQADEIRLVISSK